MSKENVKGLLLADLWELCYKAHRGTSFYPEKRATSYVTDYSAQLEEDLAALGEKQGNYKEKFIAKFSAWMSAKGNCISSMIAGPSNFPVRRAEKANNSEHNRMIEFTSWRERYFKAVNRKKRLSPEEELDNAIKRLDLLVINQETMKAMNKIVRKFTKQDNPNIEAMIEALKKEEFPDKLIREVVVPDYAGRWGFARYMLTNNNNTIKRTKEKIETMKNRIEVKSKFEDIVFDGGYVTIEDDRVKIFHDVKPDRAVIGEIKSNGFRWSPNWGCWCRQHTANALRAVNSLSFVGQ